MAPLALIGACPMVNIRFAGFFRPSGGCKCQTCRSAGPKSEKKVLVLGCLVLRAPPLVVAFKGSRKETHNFTLPAVAMNPKSHAVCRFSKNQDTPSQVTRQARLLSQSLGQRQELPRPLAGVQILVLRLLWPQIKLQNHPLRGTKLTNGPLPSQQDFRESERVEQRKKKETKIEREGRNRQRQKEQERRREREDEKKKERERKKHAILTSDR